MNASAVAVVELTGTTIDVAATTVGGAEGVGAVATGAAVAITGAVVAWVVKTGADWTGVGAAAGDEVVVEVIAPEGSPTGPAVVPCWPESHQFQVPGDEEIWSAREWEQKTTTKTDHHAPRFHSDIPNLLFVPVEVTRANQGGSRRPGCPFSLERFEATRLATIGFKAGTTSR